MEPAHHIVGGTVVGSEAAKGKEKLQDEPLDIPLGSRMHLRQSSTDPTAKMSEADVRLFTDSKVSDEANRHSQDKGRPKVKVNYEDELNNVRQRFNRGELLAFGNDSNQMFEHLTTVLDKQRNLAKHHLAMESKASAEYQLRNPTSKRDSSNAESSGRESTAEQTNDGINSVDNAALFSSLLDDVKSLSKAITQIRSDT